MSQWISVNDGMPNKYKNVIIAFSYNLPYQYGMPMHKGKKKIQVASGYVDKNDTFQINDNVGLCNNVKVLYWMPYPTAPVVY